MTRDAGIRTEVLMGTFVTIQAVGDDTDSGQPADWERALHRAFDWFRRIEACCSRFEADSELMQLTAQVGVPVPVSDMLYQIVQFALAVAETSGGAFDPTIGREMETRGFNREHRTGKPVRTDLPSGGPVTYRDVDLDPGRTTITLCRPMILDLGAVAKGFAVDMAACALAPFRNFAIDAGGDLYLGGHNPDGAPWSVGIRHPRQDRELIDAVRVSDGAVCTSGDYEHDRHILDPRTGAPATGVASVTVVAPTAMLADALATAAFVLGPADGLRLLDAQGVEGLIVSPTLECDATKGWKGVNEAPHRPTNPAILPNPEGSAARRAGDPDGRRGVG